MTPERYKQIDELVDAALSLPQVERARYLDAACDGDEELRREVESPLAAHDQVGNYFAAPALEVAAGLLAQQQNLSLVGQSLSHYRVLSLIGAGGMGKSTWPRTRDWTVESLSSFFLPNRLRTSEPGSGSRARPALLQSWIIPTSVQSTKSLKMTAAALS